jgi:hypothetical protein
MMESKTIILFDGVCNLCNASINFVIDRDVADIFRFGTLQSEEGQRLITRHNISDPDLTSIVLIENPMLFFALHRDYRESGNCHPFSGCFPRGCETLYTGGCQKIAIGGSAGWIPVGYPVRSCCASLSNLSDRLVHPSIRRYGLEKFEVFLDQLFEIRSVSAVECSE